MEGDIKGKSGGGFDKFLWYFLRQYRVTFLLILGLAFMGIFSLVSLPRESAPEIKIPFGVVVTAYPGASARDVEELVTDPIEDQLKNLEGLKKITSSSSPGISSVSIEFIAQEDLDEALRKLREAVDKVRNLPEEAELPEVIQVSFSNEPIISVGLSGIEDGRLLTIYGEKLADQIKDIEGVSSVTVSGAQEEEIVARFDPKKLAEHGLGVNQLMEALRAGNTNAPFGSLKTERFNYDLRLVGSFNNVSDVAGIPISLPTGEVVELGKITQIEWGLSKVGVESRISLDGQASASSVSLRVVKKTGGNIVKIVEEIEEQLAVAKDEWLPRDIKVNTFADQAQDIRKSLRDVSRSGLQTLVIVFIILWLFLGWREALITSTAIPLTFFISFIVFDITGNSLNGVSLFSLILALGLLVDNAIVIVEGIHSGLGKDNLVNHAAEIVSQFKKPLVGGTLTTVAAFFPMLLMRGIIGEFIKVIPIAITSALVSSLFVALALIPVVAVRFLGKEGSQAKERWFDKRFDIFRNWYVARVDALLFSARNQKIFTRTLLVLLVIGLSLPFVGVLKTGLFPAVDIDFMIINVELPPGSNKDQTANVMSKIEELLLEVPEVSDFVYNIGSATSLDLLGGGSSNSDNLGSYFVNLDEQRQRTSIEIIAALREKTEMITGAKVVIADISAGPPTSAPVELKVIGEDLDQLDAISLQIVDELEQIPGAIDVSRDLRNSAGEFTFIFNKQALASYQLSSDELAQLLRVSVFGVEVTTFLNNAGDEVSVRLEALEGSVSSIDEIMSLPIITPTQGTIALRQLATVTLDTSINTIRHSDTRRAVVVNAKAKKGFGPNEISEALKIRLTSMNLPAGYEVVFGGEQQETAETFAQLYRSMIIAVMLILVILVLEFNSYRQPFIIILSVPLALIGVLFGLVITRGQLNFASFIGLVSLTGIVVNNAIILVDKMNRLRAAGRDTLTAVREGVKSRLRPVVLTTLTTAAGVAPLIWVDEFFRDMALTLITGLLFSSVLTLFYIPVRYLRQQQKIDARMAKAQVRSLN